MARPRKKQEPDSPYTIKPAATSGYLVLANGKPLQVLATEEAAKAYVDKLKGA